ncbi:MAG: hypothetical protein WCP58_01875 [bacterium]
MSPASKGFRGAIIFLLALLLSLSSPWGLPSPPPQASTWGATDVHAFITRQAALLWLRSYPEDALRLFGGSFDPQPMLDALVQGEAAEDGIGLSLAEMLIQMPWLSHFYDPSRGGVGFANPLTVALGFPQEPPGALEKALQDPSFGWISLLGEFREGLRQKADLAPQWEKLGHILHLLEDMSMPAHVRNDGHAGLPVQLGATVGYLALFSEIQVLLLAKGISNDELAASIYGMGSEELERYGETVVGKDPGGVDPPEEGSFLHSLLPESPSFLPEASDPTPYFQQLAEFTNTHFLSQDTVFRNYPEPPSPAEGDRYQGVLEGNDQDGYVCYLLDTVAGRTFHLARGGYFATREAIQNLGLWGRMKAWWKAVQHIGWGLDETCYRDYLEILVPRAIADTAGLLHTLALQVGEGDSLFIGNWPWVTDMRASPNGPFVAILNPGTQVTVRQQQGEWSQVEGTPSFAGPGMPHPGLTTGWIPIRVLRQQPENPKRILCLEGPDFVMTGLGHQDKYFFSQGNLEMERNASHPEMSSETVAAFAIDGIVQTTTSFPAKFRMAGGITIEVTEEGPPQGSDRFAIQVNWPDFPRIEIKAGSYHKSVTAGAEFYIPWGNAKLLVRVYGYLEPSQIKELLPGL